MKFPIVCLCGSTRFKKDFLLVAKNMELSGMIVVMPNVYSKADNIKLTDEQLKLLTDIHNEKLELCDEVYIVDAIGDNGFPYIGNATRQEIEYAKKLKKPIRYFSKEN